MADNIKIGLELVDGGTVKKRISDVKELNVEVEKTVGLTKGASVALNSIQGSNRFAASSKPKTKNADLSEDDYNKTRAAVGTGAAGRDFAKQSAGLGGLVRLYATFAANIFAATAAFGALSRAADTTNLVKGLDQLGAAGGRGLGTLAKRLTEVSDGAISLRDALEATSKASAAGLTNTQILKLGEVAKVASQALGVSMPDAISRLSRGISKIEPELLDELGIFTKVDQASRDYARSIGKTVSQLTDFEKRQGFANAVLAEGATKFGNLQLDANPYTKLYASFQNLVQSGLELVNKVLGPVLNLLSQSPIALAGVIGTIAFTLLKQAVPALTQWRQGLIDASSAANKLVIETNKLRTERTVEDVVGNEIKANANLTKSYYDLVKATNLSNTTKKKLATIGDLPSLKDGSESIILLEARQKALTKLASKYTDEVDITKSVKENELAKQKFNNYNQEIKLLNDVIAKYKELAVAKQKSENLINYAEPTTLLGKFKDRFSTDSVNNRIADKAARSNTSSGILGNIAEKLPSAGVLDSFALLKTSVANALKGQDELGKSFDSNRAKLTKFGAVMTASRGALSILTTGFLNSINSLNIVSVIIGALTTAYEILSGIFSNNSKEAEAATTSIETLTEASKTSIKTLEGLKTKDPLSSISAASITAKATAFNELSTAIEDVLSKVKNQISEASIFDTSVNVVKKLFGQDVGTKAGKGIADGIKNALNLLPESVEKSGAIAKLKAVIGKDLSITGSNTTGLNFSKLLEVSPQVTEILKTLGVELSGTAGKSAQLEESVKAASKTLDELLISAIPTDSLAKLGSTSIKVGGDMVQAFSDPLKVVEQLALAVKDTSRLRFFDADSATLIVKNADEIGRLTAISAAYTLELRKIAKARSESEAVLGSTSKRGTNVDNKKIFAKNNLVDLQSREEGIRAAKADVDIKLAPFTAAMLNGAKNALIQGAENIRISIEQGYVKAGLAIRAALSTRLEGSFAGIEEQANLKKIEIGLQQNLITVQIALIDKIEDLRLVEERNLTTKKLDDLAKRGRTDSPEFQKFTEILDALDAASAGRFKGRDTQRNIIADLKKGGGAAVVAQGSQDAANKRASLAAKAAELGGQTRAIEIEKENKILALISTQRKDTLSTELSIIQARKSILDISTKDLDGLITEYTFQKKTVLEAEEARKKEILERKDIADKIALANKTLSSPKTSVADKSKAQDALLDYYETEDNLIARQNQAEQVRLAQSAQSQKEAIRTVAAYRVTTNKTIQEDEFSKESSKLEVLQKYLDYYKQLGAISEQEALNTQFTIDLGKEKVRSAQALATIENEQLATQLKLGIQLSAIDPTDTAGVQIVLDQINAYDKLYASRKAAEVAASAATTTAITDTGSLNSSLLLVTKTTSILTGVFGKLGTAIGDVANTFVGLSSKFDTLQKKQADRLSIAKKGAETEKANASTQKENLQFGIDATSKLAGVSKSFFKEKSLGYKTLSAIEKSTHLVSLALDVEKMISDGILTTESITNSVTRIGGKIAEATVDGGKAILSALSAPFPVGFVAGAAMAAIVAAILSSIGGKAPSMSGGFDAAGQQQVQGTGQTFDGGVLTARKGGALGDSTAKAEVLSKGIDLIEKHTFDNLEFSNKMLDSLRGIRTNTEGLSGILLEAGLNSRGLNGTGSEVNKTTKKDYASNGLVIAATYGLSLVPVVGKIVNSVLGSVFGGKRITELQDSGIAIKGTINELIDGSNGLIQVYQNIKNVKKGGWFSKDKTWFETVMSDVSIEVKDSVSRVVSGIADSVSEAAMAIGKNKDTTQALINSFDIVFKTSLQGLKPEEVTRALEAEFGVAFNQLAEKVAPELEALRKPGEEFGTTLVRIARDVQVASLVLRSANLVDITKTLGLDSVTLVENIIAKFSDGLDEFVSKTQFYTDNFITASNKLKPITKAVSEQLDKLGFSAVVTREDFVSLVSALDLTNDTQAGLFKSLLDLAPAFAEVSRAVDATKSLIVDYLEAQGNASTALAARRGVEIAELSDLDKSLKLRIYALEDEKKANEDLLALQSQAQGLLNDISKKTDSLAKAREKELAAMNPVLRVYQKYIYALEDEKDLKAKLVAARDKESSALNTTITALKNSQKTLRDFSASLKLSEQSTLIPEQKYAEAKSQLQDLISIATKVPTNDEEKAAQQDAISKITGAGNTFLTASRGLYASSEQYTQDFSSVLAILESTGLSLSTQQTDSERQLAELINSTKFLESITESSKTVADLLTEYLPIQNATSAAYAAVLAAGLDVGGAISVSVEAVSAAIVAATAQVTQIFGELSANLAPRDTNIPIDRSVPLTTDDIKAMIEAAVATNESIKALSAKQEEQTAILLKANLDIVEAVGKTTTAVEESFGTGPYEGGSYQPVTD